MEINDKLVVSGQWRNECTVFKNTLIRSNRNAPPTAKDIRDLLANYVSNENRLDYQENYVNRRSRSSCGVMCL